MAAFSFSEHSHRRYNPLTDDFVLCSPHRAKRPWQGAEETVAKNELPTYDPKCYLCPGNSRASGGVANPKYESTYVFPNDFPAVQLDQPEYEDGEQLDLAVSQLKQKLLRVSSVRGKCYVICFSPNHALTLPLMTHSEITLVVDTWQSLYFETKSQAEKGEAPFTYLQIFENKGLAMGCSNPHPHGQAWCLDVVPTEVSHELANMAKYVERNNSHLLADYVELELAARERIVTENDSFLVVVPFWAVWPFETLLLAKTHLPSLAEFSEKHKADLAAALKTLTTKYDNLFKTSFPYSMGLHQAPLNATDAEKKSSWFHMHFYPPLLRSATVKKFLVGFEMLGEAQRDLTSEQAATRLSELDGVVHYTKDLHLG
ncbi:galactose-1-phosphate uridyl transferase [Metschnikowia bicuspidata var. bicuspidata NRRL YB-4993]|uniref:Galactose-1-phosphate uridylyltransferase n=1 Tax=Metschnikowia bicuspidata var. bicuspidata NRRL YB-4993 TaxID=869754 RepID=A0A1A0HGH1_9ASCO|nr:galactose-1-phosphate uridyl transferase [Metschnikowia bicuspidata var. bicuspidata NRRL YB-4993]OBA23090.1 galactose-1-phosphate uridyl transferase [Metschnikowia bicuspidata var. bicuspidata NRRL YB-4993]